MGLKRENQHQRGSSRLPMTSTTRCNLHFCYVLFFVEKVNHSEHNLSSFTTFVKYIIEFHIFISVKEKYLKLFILWHQRGKEQTDQRKYLEKNYIA